MIGHPRHDDVSRETLHDFWFNITTILSYDQHEDLQHFPRAEVNAGWTYRIVDVYNVNQKYPVADDTFVAGFSSVTVYYH